MSVSFHSLKHIALPSTTQVRSPTTAALAPMTPAAQFLNRAVAVGSPSATDAEQRKMLQQLEEQQSAFEAQQAELQMQLDHPPPALLSQTAPAPTGISPWFIVGGVVLVAGLGLYVALK